MEPLKTAKRFRCYSDVSNLHFWFELCAPSKFGKVELKEPRFRAWICLEGNSETNSIPPDCFWCDVPLSNYGISNLMWLKIFKVKLWHWGKFSVFLCLNINNLSRNIAVSELQLLRTPFFLGGISLLGKHAPGEEKGWVIINLDVFFLQKRQVGRWTPLGLHMGFRGFKQSVGHFSHLEFSKIQSLILLFFDTNSWPILFSWK